MDKARIGILTVSDRASDGTYEDRSGPAVEDWLDVVLASEWVAIRRLVPDEQDRIERELISLADDDGCCLVITTGGTGPAPRDVARRPSGGQTRPHRHTSLPSATPSLGQAVDPCVWARGGGCLRIEVVVHFSDCGAQA